MVAEEATFEGALVDVASFSVGLGFGCRLKATFKSLFISSMGDWALSAPNCPREVFYP